MRWYDGTDQPSPERLPLRAGGLSMVFEAGTLRYIRLGDHEIIRSIYAAVRDQNWGTVPAELRDLRLDVRDDSFDITFTSDHQQGDIHFIWRGEIHGGADSTLRFTFTGEAMTAFKRNRIGFCILHPMEVAGLPCEVEHVDGAVEGGSFPQFIAPHQPFFDIRAITHEVLPGVRAEVRMEGDSFEMEDQRNWTDASFKTYCTPLGLPFPVALEAGARVEQSVSIRVLGQPPAVSTTEQARTLTIDTRVSTPLPPIGLVTPAFHILTPREIERLKALNLSHLRFDLHLVGNIDHALEQATRVAQRLGCSLEIALHVRDVQGDLAVVQAAVDRVKPPVTRWIVFEAGKKSTPREVVEVARTALSPYNAPLGAGTDAFFTELNRVRPPADLLDWVAYSLNPQVHAFDNLSLVETLAAQGVTVESTRQFSDGAKIAVTPITFRMRWNPNATAPDPPTSPGELPRLVDPRQMSLFGAGWTMGSIKSLSRADSLTYYETSGWAGVMEVESGSLLPDKFPSISGGVFPMYHIFADVGEFRGGEVLSVTSSDSLLFDALALRKENSLRILVANYTNERQVVKLTGVDGAFVMKSLDETTVERAVRTPEIYRTDQGETVEAGNTGLEIELLPYAVVRLDQRVSI